ncbi:MAG: hypothetical protein JST65_10920 [Acidobacteria bacterium]|nr:hypothetical protein [Acidobacteriota bacterium]
MDQGLIQRELTRVLAHPLFARARVLRELLAYLVESKLAGRKVNESNLAVRIFDKESLSFHPYKHANVRVQFRNLRLKLEAYYLAEPAVKVKFRAVPYEVVFDIADPAMAEARRMLNEARWLFESRFPVDLHHAIGLVGQIVERHPRWAPAMVALNQLHISIAVHGGGPPLANLRLAETYADRALEYEPDDGLANAAKAATEAFLHWRWNRAEELFDRAMSLHPGVRHESWYLAYLTGTHRASRAAQLMEDCLCASDRPWPSLQTNLGITLLVARRTDEAARELLRAGKLNPEDWCGLAWLGVHYWQKGEYLKAAYTQARALAQARRSPPDRYFDMSNDAFFGSRKATRLSSEHRGGVSEVGTLVAGVMLRQWDRAIGAVERMYENRYPLVHFFATVPLMDPLWEHPRFRAAYEQTGLALPPHVKRALPA